VTHLSADNTLMFRDCPGGTFLDSGFSRISTKGGGRPGLSPGRRVFRVDGTPDILVGAEDGHFYHLEHPAR
jgi:hypothetical protein